MSLFFLRFWSSCPSEENFLLNAPLCSLTVPIMYVRLPERNSFSTIDGKNCVYVSRRPNTHTETHTCVCVCVRASVKASCCVVECVVWGQRLVVVLLGVSSTLPVHRGFMQRSACLKNSCQKRQRTQGVFVGVSERSVALEISCSASWGTDISFQRVRNSAVSQTLL